MGPASSSISHCRRVDEPHAGVLSICVLTLAQHMLQRLLRKGVSLALLLLASVCATLFAQSDLSSVSGFVRDASNAVVPAAQVTLTNEATGAERSTKTNDAG